MFEDYLCYSIDVFVSRCMFNYLVCWIIGNCSFSSFSGTHLECQTNLLTLLRSILIAKIYSRRYSLLYTFHSKKQVTQLHVRVIYFKLYFVRACYGIFHRQEETPLINGSI